jgi:hypothetical protein
VNAFSADIELGIIGIAPDEILKPEHATSPELTTVATELELSSCPPKALVEEQNKITFTDRWNVAKAFIITNFIPLGFAVVVAIALPYPYPGIVLSSLKVGRYQIINFLNVCLVFLISGVTLKVEDLWAVLKFPWAIVYGLVGINFITTLIAFIMIQLPFKPSEFSVGLTIFCVVPTTLGVGVALTQVRISLSSFSYISATCKRCHTIM